MVEQPVGRTEIRHVYAELHRSGTLTARQIAQNLRSAGHASLNRRRVNQVLYALLGAGHVVRSDSGATPFWCIVAQDQQPEVPAPKAEVQTAERPENAASLNHYRIGTTSVRVLLSNTEQPNDPYQTVDWADSSLVATVNLHHPFWRQFDGGGEARSVLLAMAAVEAYVRWKSACLTTPLDYRAIWDVRQHALRSCRTVRAIGEDFGASATRQSSDA